MLAAKSEGHRWREQGVMVDRTRGTVGTYLEVVQNRKSAVSWNVVFGQVRSVLSRMGVLEN